MSILEEVLQANERYAADFGAKAELTLPATRGLAILTCQDPRLIPPDFAGFTEGEAVVVRNAGGRATDDAIRSLAISHKLLGTKEWFVIHHDDCGMELVSDEQLRNMWANSLDPAELDADGFHEVGTGSGTSESEYVNWLTIGDQRPEPGERRHQDPQPRARVVEHPDLRAPVRHQDRTTERGSRGHPRRQGRLTAAGAARVQPRAAPALESAADDRPGTSTRQPATADCSPAISSSQRWGSRPTPISLASLNRMTPSWSMRNVPRLDTPASELNTP